MTPTELGPGSEGSSESSAGRDSSAMSPAQLIREQIRSLLGPYERFHDSKQNRAYLAVAAYVGVGITMLARSDRPWDNYSFLALGILSIFVVILSGIVFRFVWLEFDGRRYASDIIGAFVNVYSTSLSSEFDRSLLEPVSNPRFHGQQKWPRAIAQEFERLVLETHRGVWEARALALSAMVLTFVAFAWHVLSVVVGRP